MGLASFRAKRLEDSGGRAGSLELWAGPDACKLRLGLRFLDGIDSDGVAFHLTGDGDFLAGG
jgi:hypothetical protein